MAKPDTKNISVVIPAYNEENTLAGCITKLTGAAEHARLELEPGLEVRTVIGINGCTDNTSDVANRLASECDMPISIIYTKQRGMIRAEQECLDHITQNHPGGHIIFLDADAAMNKDVIKIFLEQYRKHPDLKMVGAHPRPLPCHKLAPHDQILHYMLNFRAYFPESQVAVNDVKRYHPFARSDPQPIGAAFEEKSKIMIHGRCFSIRDASVWDVPVDAIGEDSWLNLSVNTKYGPGSSRMMYNANVMFHPIDDMGNYIRVYARIHKDIAQIVSQHPEFAQVAKDEETMLSDEFLSLNPIQDLAFTMYKSIETKTNLQFSQGIYTASNVEDLWDYKSKKPAID